MCSRRSILWRPPPRAARYDDGRATPCFVCARGGGGGNLELVTLGWASQPRDPPPPPPNTDTHTGTDTHTCAWVGSIFELGCTLNPTYRGRSRNLNMDGEDGRTDMADFPHMPAGVAWMDTALCPLLEEPPRQHRLAGTVGALAKSLSHSPATVCVCVCALTAGRESNVACTRATGGGASKRLAPLHGRRSCV